MKTFAGFLQLIKKNSGAALLAGAALFVCPQLALAVPMTGYVGVLGAGQYQGINEGSETTGGVRLEFTRLVKFISLDLRYASGTYNYMGGSLKFFQHWETSGGNHWTLGGGPGALYAPDGNSYGNSTQVNQSYIEYFLEGNTSFVWDFQNGIGTIFQLGVNAPFQRKYQGSSADPNNAGYLKFRPYLAVGLAVDVD